MEQFNKDFIEIFNTLDIDVYELAAKIQLSVPTIRRYLDGTTSPFPAQQLHILNFMKNLQKELKNG